MDCPVCYCAFEGSDCPVCGFPVVESPDIDALMGYLQPKIRAYRRTFLQRIRIGVRRYVWKEEDGAVTLDRTEVQSFGTADALCDRVTWLPQDFARDPTRDRLLLQTEIRIDDKPRVVEVPLENLTDAALQNVGIEVSEDLTFRLLLRSGQGGQSASEKMRLCEAVS